MPKIKQKHKKHRPVQDYSGNLETAPPPCCHQDLPYPYDGLTRTDLSAVQALGLVEGLLKPTTALLATLSELFHAAGLGSAAVCFPEDVEEVLVLASTQLREASRFLGRWRAAHTTEWP